MTPAQRATIVVERHRDGAVFADDEPGDEAVMVRPYQDGSGRVSLVIQGCDDERAASLLLAALTALGEGGPDA
jgi:hypothetical protein